MSKILITGGLGGLGQAIVKELRDKNFECLLTSSKIENCHENVYHWDMTQNGSSKKLWDNIKSEEINTFIHCAHIFSDAILTPNIKPEALAQSLSHNTTELFTLLQFLCRKFNRKKNGSINIIGSLIALNPAPGKLIYITEKMAIQGMLSALKSEYPQLHFKIFHPGLTATEQVLNKIPKNIQETVGEMLAPENVAGKIVKDLIEQNNQFIVEIRGNQKW